MTTLLLIPLSDYSSDENIKSVIGRTFIGIILFVVLANIIYSITLLI